VNPIVDSDHIGSWNEVLDLLTGIEKSWILSYNEHDDPIARQLLDLDDYVNVDLKGIPNEWCVQQLRRLISLVRKKSKSSETGRSGSNT